MASMFNNVITEAKEINLEEELKKLYPYKDFGEKILEKDLEDYIYRSYVRDVLVRNLTWMYPSVKNFELILDRLKDSENILDVGCGSGIFGKYILSINKNYTGVRLKSKFHVDDKTYVDKSHIVELEPTEEDPDGINILKGYLTNSKEDTWLLIWPPYQNDVALVTLEIFKSNPNVKKLIYVGELYGCTGTDKSSDVIDEMTEDKDNFSNRYLCIDTYDTTYDRLIEIIKK